MALAKSSGVSEQELYIGLYIVLDQFANRYMCIIATIIADYNYRLLCYYMYQQWLVTIISDHRTCAKVVDHYESV